MDTIDCLFLDRERSQCQRLTADYPCFEIKAVNTYHSPFGGSIWVAEAVHSAGDGAVPPREITVSKRRYVRRLDRFYLPERPDAAVSAVLFDMEAERYDAIVDIQRNLSNIKDILSQALEQIPRRTVVRTLDFGCGTGLSVEAVRLLRCPADLFALLGTDCSDKMLRLASLRGLATAVFDDWRKMPAHSFDVVIASYVFHCGLEPTELSILAKQIAPWGVLVGNYHHGNQAAVEHLSKMAKLCGLRRRKLSGGEDAIIGNPILVFEPGA